MQFSKNTYEMPQSICIFNLFKFYFAFMVNFFRKKCCIFTFANKYGFLNSYLGFSDYLITINGVSHKVAFLVARDLSGILSFIKTNKIIFLCKHIQYLILKTTMLYHVFHQTIWMFWKATFSLWWCFAAYLVIMLSNI